ncbi:MAG TPA: hypothetical protein PLI12_10795 [Acetobacteraceae bacterium]|jgi:hypothetical protein|nr:hypothetical protein [Acetobacteraceae bacterium]HQU02926.1 hypothetical protein [Acetobacteraceae bacterium]
MKSFIKTTIGDRHNLLAAFGAVLLALLVFETPLRPFAGLVLPLALFGGAVYLARK